MDLRDHITGETAAFVERLVAAADAATARVRLDADAELAALRRELEEVRGRIDAETSGAAALRDRLEAEQARASALESDLEMARAASAAGLEAASNEMRSLREMLESARTEAIRASEALEAEAAQKALLLQEHETTVAELLARVEAAGVTAKTLEASLADAETRAREAEADVQFRVKELQEQLDQGAERVRASDVRVEAAEAALARASDALTEANALTDAAGGEMTILRGRLARVASVLSAAATSLEGLETARTVAELSAALIRELGTEFSRAAIFRVKGNHLEGELALGIDSSVDIQKIVVPLGMSPLLTKAAGGGGVQHATRKESGELPAPFGGSPELVVAAPLLFEGEVVAVAYADSEAMPDDAQVPFAAVLVRHANAVLAGLAQELRTSRQLRDYARTLLKEVEEMFAADVDALVPEAARVDRLRANLDFARDLYAQRSALEPPVSTNLLDDEIGRMLRGADPSIAFASALAEVRQPEAHSRKVAAQ